MQPNYLTINVIASMIINEIEKKVINILPTSSIEFDEIDYSILEKSYGIIAVEIQAL